MKRFIDSVFLTAAWRQFLETQPPEAVACMSGDRVVTAGEVLALLRGQALDPVVTKAAGDYLAAVVSEACRVVRGRFAAGLREK